MSDLPVLIGMNNPYGVDPKFALYPSPRGSTGYNIYKMVRDYDPSCTRLSYAQGFDRRNLQTGPWIRSAAKCCAAAAMADLGHCTVLLFGMQLRDAFGMPRDRLYGNMLALHGDRPVYLHWAPHPSGLNHWYNDKNNRDLVCDMLGRMYRGERGLLEWRK